MDNQLPNDFDLVIVGMGMIESILSAAASRIGKRVLHIDTDDYYGGQWASFSLEAINRLQRDNSLGGSKGDDTFSIENEEMLAIGNNLFNIENFTGTWHIPKKNVCNEAITEHKGMEEEIVENDYNELKSKPLESVWTQENLLNESRKFNIDLMPKLQFARGDFVELLISSNIARYSEYRSISRVLTWLDNQLQVVPCSRSDVFTNSKVSVIEKRMLMKLLTSLEDGSEELKNYENKTFKTFLKDKKLSSNLIHYVLYAISMSTDETPCHQGVENTKRFLNSLGRFGKTPFLFCMYGSGELPQAFLQIKCCIWWCLCFSPTCEGHYFFGDHFKALLVGEQRINAENLIMGIEKSPERIVRNFPKNLVHLISNQITTPQEDFRHVVDNLFINYTEKDENESCKPQILWSCYFSLPDSNHCNLRENVPSNVYLCPGPDSDLDYDLSIKKEEFLPRAPDPEEIVIEGEEDPTENTAAEKTEQENENTVVKQLIHNIEKHDLNEEQTTQNT
ncbi:hypothetical protein NQ317_013103 [Molorchus minor]|uniref:RAE1/2 domain-containing protein n=1 Tax=Molorchus minor TaxID=1323400 RepID=A0ABQ9JXA5_9CUCU|nr:hypothetical protein NQ317_013103 [Molorchus minor]